MNAHVIPRCLVIVTALTSAVATPAKAGLVMWNKLGSQAEVENSQVGLDGIFRGGTFVAGYFAGGAFAADHTQDFQVAFPKEVVPAAAGTIEFWARLDGFPTGIPYDGPNPCFLDARDGHTNFNIAYCCNDGLGSGGLTLRAGHGHGAGTGTWGGGGSYTYEEILGAGQAETWHHYALVWDSAGIAGIDNGTRQLAAFVDGELNTGNWYTAAGSDFAPLVSGELGLLWNQLGQGVAMMDNIKIWDYAETDFSHRFDENWTPEPTTLGLFALAAVAVLRRRRPTFDRRSA